MKDQIKEVLKEMFKSGEIKITADVNISRAMYDHSSNLDLVVYIDEQKVMEHRGHVDISFNR